ncbi:MAG: HAD hydrolase family protein [Bacteroidales bacterium]|nr:HAD hydrolase family protein [Bacteroidales bacterium]
MSKINYDLRKIKAVAFDVDGVLSPATVPLDPDGQPRRMANLRDGYAMVIAVKQGLRMAIISGADTTAVRKRFELIGVQDIFLGNIDKLPLFESWLEANSLKPEEVAYVGDDIPDLPVLKRAGLSVAPRDASPEIKEAAVYVTAAEGGYGVGRELLEEILKAQGKWPASHTAVGS